MTYAILWFPGFRSSRMNFGEYRAYSVHSRCSASWLESRRSFEDATERIPPADSAPSPDQLQTQSFVGSEMLLYPEKDTLCCVDICGGLRSRSRRLALALLAHRQPDGSFAAYSGEELDAKAKELGAIGTA